MNDYAYICEHCNASRDYPEWIDLGKLHGIFTCPECSNTSMRQIEKHDLTRITMEYISVKVAPLGRMVSEITLVKGAKVSQALEAVLPGVFEALELRVNGRPARPNDVINDRDIITLIQNRVRTGEILASYEQVPHAEPQIAEIPVVTVEATPVVEPVKRSRFESIIE